MGTVLIVFIVLVVLYFWMIMPRMFFKPDETPFQNWIYAHRGLHDNNSAAPENSQEAFRRAVESGFGIELDVQLSRDRIPVVFHDYTLDRVCGVPGKVRDHTWEELQQFTLYRSQERIPKLEDVLKLVDGKVPLIVEFKAEAFADLPICHEADKLLQSYEGVYCMESFHPLCLWWYRLHRKNILRGQLSDGFLMENYRGPLFFLLQNLMLNFLGRPDFIAYNHKYAARLSRRLCRRLFGSTAVAWTIRSRDEMEGASGEFDLFIFDSFMPEKDL